MSQTRRRLILCGLDLGPRSRDVLTYAWTKARDDRADLALVHGLSPSEVGDLGESAGVLISHLEQEIARRQQRLGELVRDLLTGGPAPSLCIEIGAPVAALLDAVARLRPDLVVLGGSGRRVLPLCSVVEKVSRRSPVPVLLVPARETGEWESRRWRAQEKGQAPHLRLVR